jgi:predicted metal-binding membrane protein
VASVWFMLLCAVVMAAEKVPAIGRRISVPLGTALLVAGALMAVAAAAVGDTSSSNYREEHHGTLVDRG